MSQETQIAQVSGCHAELNNTGSESEKKILINEIDEFCIHEIFRRRVVENPDSEAICSWDGVFSYGELDKLSSRLSNQLMSLGVKAEVLVPLCFEKSAWTIVAMIAVLKAGGAFVPLDPSYPVKRLKDIIRQTGATLILSSPDYTDLLRPLVRQVLTVSSSTFDMLPFSSNETTFLSLPRSVAYVIFTSGSTGQPKGVVIEHRAFCACAIAHGPAHRIEATSRVLQFASYSFDASLVEILTTLISGGCCCVPSATDRVNDLALAMNDLRVDLAILTPTVAALLVPSTVPLLKTLIMVGEPMQRSQIRDWENIPHLLGAYGPTEASVSAIVNSKVTEEAGHLNLGIPVGCHVWIVDQEDHNRLLDVGEIGEAIIEGPNLARGYLNDEAKTTAAFIQNVAWRVPGHRFYKTGDLMRLNADGTLDFIGRKDTQIKVRGQRVEIGEIEQCLAADDQVSQGAVLWPNHGPYAHRLVGIISLRTSSNISVDTKDPQLLQGAELVNALDCLSTIMAIAEAALPSFMVPAIILPIKSIPLLLSGKVNRSKLNQWVEDLEETNLTEIQTIRDIKERSNITDIKLESSMLKIWAEVLNIPPEQIALDKSFLALGGDSISAMQIVAKCRAEGMKTTVQDILKWKSIDKILPHVVLGINFAPIADEEIEKPFDLSPIQQMFFEAAPDGESHFNQSFLLRVKNDIKLGNMQEALEALVKRHSMLRARFEIGRNGLWTQRITTEISSSYRFQSHDLTSFDEILPVQNTKQKTLNILNGPIFICDLFHIEQETFLSVITHHAVVDLVSWRIILQDLEEVLASPGTLPDVPVSFQTWCKMQTQHIQKDPDPKLSYQFVVPNQNLEFWEMENRSNIHGDVLEVTFELNKELTTSLLRTEDCHKAMRTEPVDLFISALCYSFRQEFPEHETPSIYLEGHGREVWNSDIDISQTVGWFTTLHPLCIPLHDTNTAIDAVCLTKDLRRAIPEKGSNYLASRYLKSEGLKVLGMDGQMEFVFNYSGLYQQFERSDSLLEQVGPAQESTAGSMPRFSLFEITATIEQGHLRFVFGYNRHMAHQERIQKWTLAVKKCLNDLVEELKHLPIQYTLSDFPQAQLTYGSLENMVRKILPNLGLPATAEIEDIYPCAPLQQGILMSQAIGSASYNTHTMWEVEPGPGTQVVDMKRLGYAWKRVTLRHPSLRTLFVDNITSEACFHQVVLKGVEVNIAMRKWDSKSLELHHPRVESSCNTQLPYLLTIYEADEGRVFCSLNISHAVMDGLSIDNIVRDMLLAYDDRLELTLGSPYSDYVSFLRGHTGAESLEFWKTRLLDVGPCFFPRLQMESSLQREVRSVRSVIAPDDARCLWEYCDEGNVTMSTLFQLAWSLVLQSYVGIDDVCFGYLVSGRDVPIYGIQDAVGAFANMLVCRADLSETMTPVSSVLEDMQQRAVENVEHQFCSLAEIQNALGVSAFFNTIMSFQRHEVAKVATQSSIEFEKRGEYDPSEYDLALGVHVFDRKIFLKMDFQSDVLSRGHANHVMETLKTVLISLVNKNVQDIEAINRVGSQGWDTILSLTDPELERSNDNIHSTIEERVRRCPTKIAIEAWDVSFLYCELYELSRLAAQELINIGVGPQSIVPLYFEKSGWTTVAMLAVMTAGGAFVLLDPSHPRIRLEEIIDQVSATVIISSPQQAHVASTFVKTVYTVGEGMINQVEERAEDLGGGTVASSNTAFVIFTSGSTGKPKGVIIEHGAYVSAAKAHSEPLEFTESSRVLQFASYSFDACILETLTTLISGGTVCIPSESDRSSNLPKTMRDFKITWANLTPLVADLLLNEDLISLQTLVVAGEAMTNNQLRAWAGSSTHLINGYGPTEASVAATLNLKATHSVPSNIGRPVGCRIWLIDDRNKPAPIGALGELIIDGPTLARGYLGDSNKTASSFVAPPSWLKTRYPCVYRTGDMARYNLDGSISFVGRKDKSQVKIRGQRVELREVEDNLRSCLPNRGPVVVEFGQDPSGHGQLTAFMVLPGGKPGEEVLELTEEVKIQLVEIQQSLTLSLPKYMVPDMYVPLTKMPLKLSGKMDRYYLNKLVSSFSQAQRELYSLAMGVAQDTTPETEMEKRLQNLWRVLLGHEHEQIRTQSNFFKIGGDSILAMKLATNAHKEDLALTVSAIFQNPTLQSMASYLDTTDSMNQVSGSDIAPFSLLRGFRESAEEIRASVASQCDILPAYVQDIYPCTPLQEGIIALSMKQPGSYTAQYVLRLPTGLDIERFKLSWEEVVTSTEIFRTRIVVYNSTMLQVVVGDKINWQYSQDQEISITAARNAQMANFGMPLQRFEIVDVLDETFFRLTAHHAVYDGCSLLLLFKRLEECYSGYPLQQLMPFKSFIGYLVDRNPGSSEYWHEQFLGADLHIFPEVVPEGYICNGHESTTRTLIPPDATSTAITLSTILRATWAIVIAQLTSSDDVLFGAVLSGRNVPLVGAADIVGPTITTVPIRVKLDSSRSISQFLQHLQNHATNMIHHEHTGLQAIKAFSKIEEATAFTSVLVVQSKDMDGASIKCMGSEVVSATNANFDSYPLVLEYKPGNKGADIICARYDTQIIPSEQMQKVLEDFEFVLQHIRGNNDMKLGEISTFETEKPRFVGAQNGPDAGSRKKQPEMISKEQSSQFLLSSNRTMLSGLSTTPQRHAPATKSEKQLQELWSRLLGVSMIRICLEDNFFRLGGDSVLAIKLTTAARAKNLNLPVATIFNNPILGDMAKQIESSSNGIKPIEPFALVESSKTDTVDSAAHQCGITVDQIEDIYPCTPLQEGLMALSTKQPGAYVAQHVFRVPNSVDLRRFKEAWKSASLLHSILRTRIVLQGSTMLQVVVKDATKFESRSIHNLNDFFHENTLTTSFGAQLSRFIIAERGDEIYFGLLLHHVTFDAWSLPRLFTDISRFYERAAISQPVQYNNFINYIMKANTESSASFWATYLRGLDTSHFPQLASSTYTPAETRSTSRQVLISRPSESQMTTSTLLRAAWAITLGHYSNCEDVVFCTTLSGRNAHLQGILDVTGPTITTVPIRVDLRSDQPVKEFLQTFQSQATIMIPFEQYGLQNIRRLSNDAMNACDAPTLLVIQPEDNKDNLLLGLESVASPVPNLSSYPLAIECKIGKGYVDLFGYIDESVIPKSQMQRILCHFEHILKQLNFESSDPIGELSNLSPYDHETIQSWNKDVPQGIEKCIHEITHDRAIETPNMPAVWAWDVEWSHSELDRLSSCLAYDLIQAGVKSEVIVPVCFERSGWMVVAMLGILKAGGAFLPWDPAHPAERRKAMILQTGSEIIVTSKQQEALCSGLAKTIFVVDPASLEGQDEKLKPHSDSHSAAYVIYTSGSTGKPKGVVIEHKSYSTSALAHGPVHHIDSKSRVSQFASYSVDAICLEILTTIMLGGCTCICSDFRRSNGLSDALSEMGVTVAALTPSVLSLLSPEELPKLKTVIMVGEPASTALVETWERYVHLINGYGPTETSLSAVMNETMTSTTKSNIGSAVGCVTWIADMHNHEKLVPVGCIGELLIEGPTLARGYLNDVVKTTEAFVTNPGWLDKTGTRVYKTGDLVRYDPDGTVVFIGRKDMQVKINGHRIELGEIEHHITQQFPSAEQTAVEMITSDESQVLVAIITIKETKELSPYPTGLYEITSPLRSKLETLERSIRSTLPAYMVPSLWVPMIDMPIASSGKVDRKRLREVATTVWNTQRSHYSLSDGSRRQPTGAGLELREMWAIVLNLPVEEIGADDNFFRIGGDSVSAMKLAGYVSKQGLELSVASIFMNPALDDMVKVLALREDLLKDQPSSFSTLGAVDVGALLEEIRPQLSNPTCAIQNVMPSTDFQAWAVSYGMMNAGFITYMLLTPSKKLDAHRLESACHEVVASHSILRTAFVINGSQILQVVLQDPSHHFEHIECTENIDITWNQWFQSQKSLQQGENIVKFVLLSHGAEQRLIMRISHAQYDGISFPLIWDCLSRAYDDRVIAICHPFSTFISARSEKTDARKYWKDLLANSRMTSVTGALRPSSYARPLDQGAEKMIDLPAVHPDFTLATIVKAAWSLLLSQTTGESDLVFGSLVSGRSSLSLDSVVGPCLNIIPVRVGLDSSWKVLDLLRHIQEQQFTSMSFETLGFRDIVKSTDWSLWTRYSSVVQHQNIPELKNEVIMGEIACETSAYRINIDTSDIVVLSTPLDGQLKLELGYCEQTISHPEAKLWLECLCLLVTELPKLLDNEVTNIFATLLGELKQAEGLAGYSPSSNTSYSPTSTPTTEPKSPSSSLCSQESKSVESKLRQLWHEILDDNLPELLPTSLFSLSGADIISTCVLASRLQQEGYDVTMKEILDNDTLEGQAALIMMKQDLREADFRNACI